MTVYNEDIKKLYLNQLKATEETKDVYMRIFKKSFEREQELGKDLHSFTEEEFEAYFKEILKPKTKESARSVCNVLANYVQWAMDNKHSKELFNPLKHKQEYFYEFVEERKTYINFKEKQAILSLLENKQDAVIIEALWHGIQGTRVSEIVNLKMSDINRKEKTIKLRNDKNEVVREIKADNTLIEMCILANSEPTYYKSNGTMNELDHLNEVELIDSEYIIKKSKTVKKSSASAQNNDESVSHVTHYVIYNRIDMIKNLEEFEVYSDALTSKNIVRSGMIYNALKLYDRDGELERKQIEEICAMYNMKYKWALRDFLNLDMLNELYPDEMEKISAKK